MTTFLPMIALLDSALSRLVRMVRFRSIVCGALTVALAAGPVSAQVAQQQPAPQAQAALERLRGDQLIQQAEMAYAAGVSDYRNGRLPEAKADFDRAIDLLLTSDIDIKRNQKLSDELDRLVDAINSLEMEALKQGNGFAPKLEPTPADVASDVTFEPGTVIDPSIAAKARAQLATTKSDLPLVINDYVAGFINFFANTQKGHNTLKHSLERSGKYKAMIEKVMAEEGVPQDLIYLAVAESSFQPQVVNRSSGAGGMWQFMPHGDYGLERNGYVDERFDPTKSTRAYAKYMKFLYNQLGDWYLAMAAYDWGAGNVQRAVGKTGYADFWELYRRNNLPGETKNYVPEILAAIIISKNLKQYGFDDVQLDAPVLPDMVTLDSSVDLRLVADIVNVPVEDIAALNPSLLRMVTPDSGYDLHLPAGTGAEFKTRLAEIPPAKRTIWRYHRVAGSDTLQSVAERYRVSVSDLAAANRLSDSDGNSGNALRGVDALVVPVAPVSIAAGRTLVYKTRRGDTMVTIADRFGVSIDDLQEWNHISGSHVEPGRRLYVAEPARVPHGGSGAGRGREKSGAAHGSKASRSKSGASATHAGSSTKVRSSGHATTHATASEHAPQKSSSAAKHSAHEEKKHR